MWLLWGVFLVLVALGLATTFSGRLPRSLLAPVHALTMLLLPLLVLAAVGQTMRGAGGSEQGAIGGLLSGAIIGTGLAMVAEAALFGAAIVLAIGLGILPGDMEALQSLAEELSASNLLIEPDRLAQFLTPPVLVGAFLFVAVLTPLIEEFVKTLGLGIAGVWLRPTPARAFLLGVASGAGFALVENVLNGALLGPFWPVAVLSRLAATFMHCATAGLAGWGWGQLWTARRPGRWLLAWAGAASLHGIWNGLVVGVVGSGLIVALRAENQVVTMAGGLVVMVLLLALLLVVATTLAGLFWAAWRLRRRALDSGEEPEQPGQGVEKVAGVDR
jgi:RsiW-degrading membrane proteinase PrsW (M82 family)